MMRIAGIVGLWILSVAVVPTTLAQNDAKEGEKEQKTASAIGPLPFVPAKEIDAFNANVEVAQWMVFYDRAAWLSSDVVMKAPAKRKETLGPEWFCYEEDDGWHAVYGKLSDDGKRYSVVFHFVVDDDGKVAERKGNAMPPDTLPLTRALRKAHAEVIKPTLDTLGVRLNPYVRKTKDAVEVWIGPTWQPNGVIAFGQTHHLTFSKDGKTLKKHQMWNYELRGVRPSDETQMALGSETFTHPTVGDIFFVLHYGRHFKSVTVQSKSFTSTLIAVGDERIWAHVIKEDKVQAKKAETEAKKTAPPKAAP